MLSGGGERAARSILYWEREATAELVLTLVCQAIHYLHGSLLIVEENGMAVEVDDVCVEGSRLPNVLR